MPLGLSPHNMALNLAPFGRWTLRDKAAQRRLALRYTDMHRACLGTTSKGIQQLKGTIHFFWGKGYHELLQEGLSRCVSSVIR